MIETDEDGEYEDNYIENTNIEEHDLVYFVRNSTNLDEYTTDILINNMCYKYYKMYGKNLINNLEIYHAI